MITIKFPTIILDYSSLDSSILDVSLVSISSTFYVAILCRYFGAKNYKAVNWVWNLLAPKYWQKRAHKMLMKSTPGVDFINILCTAFMLVDPKSVKRYWQLDWVLTLSGSASAKAVRRTLMKLTPGCGRDVMQPQQQTRMNRQQIGSRQLERRNCRKPQLKWLKWEKRTKKRLEKV